MAHIVAVVLVGLLLLVPQSAHAATPFERPRDALRELSGERTETTRAWRLKSGETVTQIAGGPVQWRDESGTWHSYDLDLRRAADE